MFEQNKFKFFQKKIERKFDPMCHQPLKQPNIQRSANYSKLTKGNIKKNDHGFRKKNQKFRKLY